MLEGKRVLCSKRHLSVFFMLLFVCILAEQIHLKKDKLVLEAYLDEKNAYVEEYNQFYDKIVSEAGSMKQMNLFSDETGFSYRNIEKTVKDYEPIEELRIQAEDTRAEEAFLNTGTADILFFVYLLFLITIFFDERKKGVWSLQHSTKKGDSGLLFWRFLILIFGSVLFFSVLHTIRKVSMEYLYQRPLNLKLPVQSIENYRNICFSFDLEQYFFYYFAARIVTAVFIGLFWWMILSFQKSNAAAYILFFIFLSTEYLCYYFISENSKFVFFRFCNIFSVIYPKEITDRYLNLNVWGYPVGIQAVFFLCVMVLNLLMLLLLLWMKKKQRPYMEYHKVIAYITENRRGRFSCFSHLGTISAECYKLIFSQRGISILLLMIYFMVTFSGVPDLHKGSRDAYCQELYQEYGGAVTEEALQELYHLSCDSSIENEDYKMAINKVLEEAKQIYALGAEKGREIRFDGSLCL